MQVKEHPLLLNSRFVGIFWFSFLFFSLCSITTIKANSSTGGNNSSQTPPLVKKVRQVLNSIKPFQIKFVQQVYTDDQLDVQESGVILYQDENHLKWTYTDPDFKVFLLLENEYQFYDEDNEQLMKGKVTDWRRMWIWQILFSDDMAPFTRTETGEDGNRIFILNEAPGQYLNVEILLDGRSLPVKVIQVDPAGIKMIYLFSQYLEKINISPGTFELKIPKDVEIIYEGQ